MISWDASKSGPASYSSKWDWARRRQHLVVSGTRGAATRLTEKDVARGTYLVRVRARNACGNSAPSEPMTIVVR